MLKKSQRENLPIECHGDCETCLEVDACGVSSPSVLKTLTAKQIGMLGEQLAASFFVDRGYELLERNYRCREGEADLVVHDPGTDEIVLVEVKTRRLARSAGEVYPEEAVDDRKQLRYSRIAACYVLDHYPVMSIRFDVVAISLRSDCEASLEHIMSAFSWDGDR